MRMFRNYDGNGSTFGDTSISAVNTDNADTSIYASTDSTSPGRMVLIAINHTMASMSADIALQHTSFSYTSFTVYQLTSSSATTSDGLSELPTLVGTFPIAQLGSYQMPAESVSTIVLLPAPEPAALGVVAAAALLIRRANRRRCDNVVQLDACRSSAQ